jgi:hypothetical protein
MAERNDWTKKIIANSENGMSSRALLEHIAKFLTGKEFSLKELLQSTGNPPGLMAGFATLMNEGKIKMTGVRDTGPQKNETLYTYIP